MLDFNQLMSNALGYYETFDFLPSGARVRYVHDQPLLAESQYIWKYSAEGYGWTDQGWQDGEPVWEGIDVAGNIVGKTLSVIGVKAEWLDVDDLSAISGRFSSLIAGASSGSHLQLIAESGKPYLRMYDTSGTVRVSLEQDRIAFSDATSSLMGHIRGYDGRLNFYTSETAIDSRSWIELWGDSIYPDRQGEIIMAADHFVWRIDGSTTSAGTDAMRLNADGSLSILGNIARGDNGRLNFYTNTTSKNSWAWMEFWGYDPNYGRSGELMFGGSKFTVRLGSTDTSAGVDKLILDDSGLNAVDGLRENGIALADKYASKSHTHSYLPLSGGVVDGNIIATGRVRANSYFQVGTAIGITQEVLYTDRVRGARTMQFTGGILTSWN